MPGIKALSESLTGNRISFLAVTQDDRETVRKFLKRHALPVPVYVAGDRLPADLSHIGIPVTYILDAHGAIVLREGRAANWDTPETRRFLLSLQNARS
jgi:peroxiredoxin